MRSARALIAVATMATLIPTAALADNDPTYPKQMGDAALATAAVTESEHEVCFSVEWIVSSEGVRQDVQPDFACATNTTTTRSASSSTAGTLLSAVSQLAKVDRVECVVTADGRFTTRRALGSTTTTHDNNVVWTSECFQYDETGALIDVDPDDEDSPACVDQSALGVARVTDQGLWINGGWATGFGRGEGSGCDLRVRVRLDSPKQVGILGSNNVHGTGSPLEFRSQFDLDVDVDPALEIGGIGDQTFCVTAVGRQDMELLPSDVC